MSTALRPPHGVMEGKGAYNKHSQLPAGGAGLALPLLDKAVQAVELGVKGQPIVIADYGSSQAKNSMVPMQLAIRGLRRRIGPNRAISVFHIDQPSNDFNALFAVLTADANRYMLDEPNVFPAAIGRSFYESILPPGSVHFDGPRMPRSGSAAFQRSYRATSFLLTARARFALNSTARPRRIGKPFCRYAQKNCGREGAW